MTILLGSGTWKTINSLPYFSLIIVAMHSPGAFSPDGSRIVSGSYDNTVRVWDAMNGDELKSLSGHTSGVNSVTFSPDGSYIVSGSDDNTVLVWDAMSGEDHL